MESHVLVVADVSCSPENAVEFGRILHEFAGACREEPGCLSYEVFRSEESPQRYVSIEKYADAAAFAAHRDSDHFREIGLERVFKGDGLMSDHVGRDSSS
ncbi:antibiotic biosynthesis monooxygenase [Kitasatospora sp. NBC_00240]|uniref:putative quinol monooxygenase n=1 Tax=Kitasatospora sp. NBC_00240 TaxID=2903567 RepID=UPI00224CF9BB|nr:antibiotic biosynthesis monooxygenase [Kitasatospora sp. NBC_00240]MCX5208570.1 antibiotic biosynthesis monooxygenase [Kitasatospora sp. NBC_00240]